MFDEEFDRMLEQEIEQLPPDQTLADSIDPWHSAMDMVLWGLGLTTLTLNFLNINFFQSAIGMIMLVLGFRTLRKDNGWFMAAYVVSLLRTGLFLFTSFINTTIYAGDLLSAGWENLLSLLSMLLIYLIYLCLWGGFRAVQRKAGLEPHAASAGWMLVWMTVVLVIGTLNIQSALLWLLIVAYVCIFRGLSTLSAELEETGYAIEAAPVRISNGIAASIYAVILLGSMAFGYLRLSQYPMVWQPVTEQGSEAIHTQLLELGVPEQIIEDLTDEELLSCEGAEYAYVWQEEWGADGTTKVYADGTQSPPDLRLTSVALRIPGKQVRWRIIHHIQWIRPKSHSGTECLELMPVYLKETNEGYRELGSITGRVLYDRDSITYTAPYQQMEWLGYTATSLFGSNYANSFFATFSLPKGGENQRVYLTYEVEALDEGWLLCSYCNYIHQASIMYPNTTALDRVMHDGMMSNDPFDLLSFQLVFRPSNEVPALIRDDTPS